MFAMNIDQDLLKPLPKKELPEEIQKIVDDLPEISVDYTGKIGCVKDEKFHFKMNMVDPTPVKQRPYRHNPQENKFLEDNIRELLRDDIIEPSTSEWASPLLIVEQLDHKSKPYRMVSDYRRPNAQTQKETYHLPIISVCVDNLAGCKYYTIIDLKSAYQQIPIHKDSRQYTTVCTPIGSYQFKRVQYGLTNAPACMQRITNFIVDQFRLRMFAANLHEHVRIEGYIDDFAIGSQTKGQMISAVRILFEELVKVGFNIDLNKCSFMVPEIKFLGYIIDGETKRPDPTKLAALKNMPAPNNVSKARSVFGWFNYYRRYIENFNQIAQPLVALTKKGTEFKWTDRCQESFDLLKQKMLAEPILKAYDPAKPIVIHVDASMHGLGVVMLQADKDNMLKIVECASRFLTSAESKLHINDLEAKAAHWAVTEAFLVYIRTDTPTVVYTDNYTFAHGVKKSVLNKRLKPLVADFQAMTNLVFKHFKGKKNVMADALSRNPIENSLERNPLTNTYFEAMVFNQRDAVDLQFSFILPNDELRTAQMNDPWTAKLINDLENPPVGNNSPDPDYLMVQGILCKLPDKEGERFAITLPAGLRGAIMHEYHDNFGHRGNVKTVNAIQARFFWPDLKTDVSQYIQNCPKCVQFNRPTYKHRGHLDPLPIPDRPFAHIGIDFASQRPRGTMRKKRSWICIVDYSTRFCIAEITEEPTTATVIRILRERVINHYGPIEVIVCDAASYFKSQAMVKFCEENHIRHMPAYPHFQQANGLAERTIQSVERIMSKYMRPNGSDWQERLYPAVYSYNNTVQKTVGYAPAYLLFGGEAEHNDLNWLIQFNNEQPRDKILQDIDIARTQSKDKAKLAQQQYKQQYDKNRFESSLQTGDTCLKPHWYDSKQNKFQPYWEGYFKVIERNGNNFTVQSLRPKDKGKLLKFHSSQLKPFSITPVFAYFLDGDRNIRSTSRQPTATQETCSHRELQRLESGVNLFIEPTWFKPERIFSEEQLRKKASFSFTCTPTTWTNAS
jgi:hypothetical protein